jgi:hypothetical protein
VEDTHRSTGSRSHPSTDAGCPTSRSFFARCGIPLLSPRKLHTLSQSFLWGEKHTLTSQISATCTTALNGCPMFAPAYVGRKRRAKPIKGLSFFYSVSKAKPSMTGTALFKRNAFISRSSPIESVEGLTHQRTPGVHCSHPELHTLNQSFHGEKTPTHLETLRNVHHCSERVPHVRTSVARISCYAALDTTTHAAFSQRSRMKLLNATNLDRKSGIRGPKTTGEAHQRSVFPFSTTKARPSVTDTVLFNGTPN